MIKGSTHTQLSTIWPPTSDVARDAGHRPQSPLRAIRAKCLDCSCYQAGEVRLCEAVKCPLWLFWAGKHSWRAKAKKPAKPSRIPTGKPPSRTGVTRRTPRCRSGAGMTFPRPSPMQRPQWRTPASAASATAKKPLLHLPRSGARRRRPQGRAATEEGILATSAMRSAARSNSGRPNDTQAGSGSQQPRTIDRQAQYCGKH